MLDKPTPRWEKASWIAGVIVMFLTLAGLVIAWMALRSPKPNSTAQQITGNGNTQIGNLYFVNPQVPAPSNQIIKSPSKHDPPPAMGFPTRFTTGQKLEGATWTVDGAPIVPSEPPSIYTTTLTLPQGAHKVRASSSFERCWVDISVPVSKVNQDILLNCKDRSDQ